MRSLLVFSVVAVGVTLLSCQPKTSSDVAKIMREDFQVEHDGKQVDLYTIKNSKGMVVQLTNYGGKIVSIFVPDRHGHFSDINL